ncbi:hypothetical protein [Burkholderia gladioli]|uniref:hypothetical protein n=1 Tax=Burkholderia gladioli TaxID=28095 RepID=UPI002FE42418
MVVDRFLAGGIERVLGTQPSGRRRVDPAGEGRHPLRDRQRIVVDDVVDIRFSGDRGNRRREHLILVLTDGSGAFADFTGRILPKPARRGLDAGHESRAWRSRRISSANHSVLLEMNSVEFADFISIKSNFSLFGKNDRSRRHPLPAWRSAKGADR